ncbi:MAG: AEC family transporter [Polaromonas sp.]|uniref:AEC family transporter n=1 Tax=Polaromonas sp. TaxID=1869339 RepID=UPI0025F70AF3|nr:AEC family transporter [Polaromonas sp.]MBI2726869.1 AEC family transporter [Polaromonas sp.]
MNQLVLVSLLPVVLLIAAGFAAGRLQWIRPTAVKDLSNLIFLLLTPALLFRTMSKVRIEQLDFKPVTAYFVAVAILFGCILLVKGLNRRAAVLALAGTFSNTVMIGIAMVGLMYGPAGLVILLTLVSTHALVLLTIATLVLELAVAREQKLGLGSELGTAPRHPVTTVLLAVKNAVLNPVPLPIIVGLLFAQTGLVIPEVIDRPLELLANAFGPLALVLVGVTLANTSIGGYLRPALALACVKNLLHPLLVFGICHLLGVGGLPMAVMVTASALPIGANVFLFSQRYKVAEELITASVVMSTALAMVSLTLVLLLLGRFA